MSSKLQQQDNLIGHLNCGGLFLYYLKCRIWNGFNISQPNLVEFSSNVKRQFLLDLVSWELCAHLIGSAVWTGNLFASTYVKRNCGSSQIKTKLIIVNLIVSEEKSQLSQTFGGYTGTLCYQKAKKQ